MSIRANYKMGAIRYTVMGKIVSIVAICVFLLVAASAVGIYRVRQIGSEVEHIAQIDVPLSKAISMLTAHRLEQSLLTERLLRLHLSGIAKDVALIPDIKERVDELASFINVELITAQNIASTAITSTADPDHISQFESFFLALDKISDEQKVYRAVSHKALEMARVGNKEKAYDLLGDIHAKHSAYDRQLEDMLFSVQSISQDAAKEAVIHEKNAIAFAILVNSVSAIGAILLAVCLGRRALSKPLLEVVRALNYLAKNKFDVELSGSQSDEIGDIGRAYQALKDNLQKSQQDEQAERSKLQILNSEIKLMSELNQWLQSSNSLEELFKLVSEYLVVLLPDCKGEIYIYSNSRDVLDGACSWNDAVLEQHIRPGECWGLRRGRNYFYGNREVNFKCDHTHETEENLYMCLPFLAHGETLGLMHLSPMGDMSKDDFGKQCRLAQKAAEQISLAIANTRMRDELHNQSIRDSLTGLFNRRHFLERFRSNIDWAKHHDGSVSLIAIDVDHFKQFNDNHGHDAGDMVLRSVGTVLEQCFEGDHIPCRIGGEEFVALLPDTSSKTAAEIAEKLRVKIENLVVRYGEKRLPKITISCGVASYPQHGEMPQDLIKIADDALYTSKGNGRNQVTIADLHAEDENAEATNKPHILKKQILDAFDAGVEEDTLDDIQYCI